MTLALGTAPIDVRAGFGADPESEAALALDLEATDRVLRDLLDERVERASRHGTAYRRLWEAARDEASGGKRIRPELVLRSHRAWGAPNPAGAVRVAAAFELLHTAFLMHDDVIDGDRTRRGVPNLAGRLAADAVAQGAGESRAYGYGDASAILAGDLLINAAHGLVARAPVSAGEGAALLDLLDECIFRTAAGEHDDVRLAIGLGADRRAILAMLADKTAAYSFSAPLQAGAILGGAADAPIAALGRIGEHLGLVFQLRDDVLGVFGDEAVTGKSAAGDLREGKETLLIAFAREHGSWTDAGRAFGDAHLDEEEATALRGAIRASGALTRVEEIIDLHARLAIAELDGSDLPPGLRAQLAATVRACSGRSR
ncbi:polyprenyl synthetase family protein [Agromyces sp. MMS24-JH15]|uniref:polyprenyl synthetase family protein n=1 Tax=Agromyces sp. MMS24-JH15 TaxID=3243765 RepID=UPI0037484680